MSSNVSGIDKNISKSEQIDLSGADIERITDGKCQIMSYEDLQHIQTLDEVLGEFGSAIILYQTKEDYGHWVSLIKYDDRGIIEFFDPYGYGIDEELKIIEQLHLRHDGIKPTPHLTALIRQSPYKVKTNTQKLQKISSEINTCGRWCALRVRFKAASLIKFINLMTKNKHYDGDFWVSALTILT
jgi:hypothetical protein